MLEEYVVPPHAEPLHRFPLANAREIEEFRHAVVVRYGIRRFEFRSHNCGFWARTNYPQLDSLALCYIAYGADVEVEFPEEQTVRYLLCRAGRADILSSRVRALVASGGSYIVNAKVPMNMYLAGGYEQVVLRFNADALEQKLHALAGVRASRKIEFDAAPSGESPEAQSLRRSIGYLLSELDAGASPSSTAVVELEQLIMTLLLTTHRHSASGLVASKPTSISPWQVRLAEEYIEAHWCEPITIETLVRVTNVSARSLFGRFRDYRGLSPMAYARQVRLKHAREMLTAPEPSTTVTGVALACGFMNTGHFARHYRTAFGEIPSTTLSHSRSLRL